MPPTVSQRGAEIRGRGLGREVGVGVERADRGRGARGVVVVQGLVRAVVDVALGAFGVEVVERPQQEVALGFEVAVEVVTTARRVHCRAEVGPSYGPSSG